MKKFTLLLTTLLVCCTSIAAFGQDNDKVQQALDAHQKKLVYKAQLAEDVVGWRLGA